MALKLITPPATYPITLAEAKAQIREVATDFDDEITAFIKAATAHAEEFTGRAFIDQTWELTYDAFPANELQIPKPPLIEVVSVKYDDANGDEQTLDGSLYVVDAQSEPAWLVPADNLWPTPFDGINSVRIRFRAGYLDTASSPQVENVPWDIKAAIKLFVGSLYANREHMVIGQTVVLMPWASEQLLRFHQIRLGMA